MKQATRNPRASHKTLLRAPLGLAQRAINEIVLGKRVITSAMSIRFGTFFGQSSEFWHGIQIECDFSALARQ